MTRQCVICGKMFSPNSNKQKTCGAVCSLLNRNAGKKARRKSKAVVKRTYKKIHTEVSNRDPDPVRWAARLAYLAVFYENDKQAKIGLQRQNPPA
jgi:hypothetical protein